MSLSELPMLDFLSRWGALPLAIGVLCCGGDEDAAPSAPSSSVASTTSGTGGGGGAGGTGPESIGIVTDCELPAVPQPGGVNFAADLAYGADAAQVLDIAWPKRKTAPVPLVVVLHAGWWATGDKIDERDHIMMLASAGYAAAALNFRLASKDSADNRFPSAVEDVRCALRWLRSKVGFYGIDPTRIAAVGTSSGAHLAAVLATESDAAGLDGACAETEAVSVSSFVGYYGLYELRDEDGNLAVENFLGALPSRDAEAATLASPIAHVDPGDPPALFVHGSADVSIPIAQSEAMRKSLQVAGVPATLVTIDGADHSFDMLSASDGDHDLRPAACTMLAFLKATLVP
jgi:acetyl esterase/lipase